MTRFSSTGKELDDPKAIKLLRRMRASADETPNFLRLLSKSLAAMRAYAAADEALARGALTQAQREQIALAVAEINGCRYCLTAHARKAKEAGMSDEEIRLAARATGSDPKMNALLGFTQLVVLQRGEVSDEALQIARQAGFSESEIIEIIGNIAINIFANYLNLIARTELDSPPTEDTERRDYEAGNATERNHECKQHAVGKSRGALVALPLDDRRNGCGGKSYANPGQN